MKSNHLLFSILAIALTSIACSVNINLPLTQVKTGPLETQKIDVPTPQDSTSITDVTLAFGAGQLTLAPGLEDALISGTATYNVPDFKPEVKVNANRVRVSQGDLEIRGIPAFDKRIQNDWDLKIGDSPIRLHINAGAYDGEYDFGGLSLQDLEINDGASNVDLVFSEPNQVEMNSFQYTTGASDITLESLANANFASMVFRSGAGSYTLDFSGDLQRDCSVTIETGLSNVKIIVPQDVSAQLSFEGGLSNVDANDSWQKSGNDYNHPGAGPTIRISVSMGAGNLELEDS